MGSAPEPSCATRRGGQGKARRRSAKVIQGVSQSVFLVFVQ